MPRLVYAAVRLGPEAVRMSRDIKRLVPNFDMYDTLAKEGINGASESLDLDKKQLNKLYRMGREDGKPTMAEWKTLIVAEVLESDKYEDMSVRKQLEIASLLDRFVKDESDTLVAVDELDLSTVSMDAVIPKFESGFAPLDMVTGGLYQAVMVIMAPPGVGKTSMMLMLMEALRISKPDWDKVFFEVEISKALMGARMAPMIRRQPFGAHDKLFTGSIPIEEIEKRVDELESKNPRVIFIDGPDAMPGLGGESRRLELGHIYRRLVSLKERCELVVVSSQPRRKDGGNLKLESVAESWEKAQYADIVIGINRVGLTRMRMKCLKNRFGPSEQEVTFEYDPADLTTDDIMFEEDEW